MAGWPDGRMAGWPHLRLWGPAMRVSPWRRWRRLLPSRPEASCSSSTGRFRPGSPPLLPFLLGLLLAGFPSGAAALTFSSTTITEGETKTITVTGFPASWTGTPTVATHSTGNTASYKTSPCSKVIDLIFGVDVCPANMRTWDSATRTLTLTLQAYEDGIDESDEHFTLIFQDSDNTSRSQEQRFTVTPNLPRVTLSGATTMEEGATIFVNVSLSEKATSACSVKVRARRADGTVWGSTAVIAAGKKAGKATVTHNNDSIWQENGWYDMPVWTAPGDCYAGPGESDTTYSVRVTDDGDPRPNRPPEFPNAVLAFSFAEMPGTAVRNQVPAAMDPDGDTLTYTMEGTDAASFEFDASTRRLSTRVGVTYDYEAKQRYSLRIKADDGRGGTDTVRVSVHVTDVDEPPSAPAVTSVVATPGSTTSLNVSWTAPDNTGKPAIGSYDLRYRAGSSGDWTNGPQDVSGTSSQITGLDSGTTYQVQVLATNDEGDGDWSNAGSGTTSGSSTTPVAAFASAASSAGEDAGTQNVAVSLSPAPQSAITLAYTVGGTATAGTDFSIANSGSVQVAANATSVNIPVAITDDTDDEEAEMVVLTLGSGTGYTVGSGNIHTLTINDNDDPPPVTPVVSIGGSPSSMTEGGTATFTLTASPAPTQDIVVAVTVAGGSFATGGPRTVTVDTSGTASFTVVTTDDETDEPNGTITATVNTGTGYSPHNTEGSASVTVNDNDDPGPSTPVASFGSATSSAAEDGGTQNVTANLSPSPQSAITVAYTVGGTATAGTDFSITNSGSVQVPANATSVNIPVTITEDTDDEANETVILTLGSGTGYRVGSGNVHTLTINDNDDPGPNTPVVSITASPPTLTEGDTATFTLTASPAPTQDIVVAITVAGGSFATGGPRTVTVGTTGTASFTVPTTDD
ncbi:MAG: hypothetical protein F4158_04560, partial [Synechococcus sp. SB0675_bin_7]|nr:hypothetical protein [Synechococcus sp. SB0675_bin_7]